MIEMEWNGDVAHRVLDQLLEQLIGDGVIKETDIDARYRNFMAGFLYSTIRREARP